MAPTLYKRQKQILQFLKDYVAQNNMSPTLQEIADHFNLSSLATVHAHLQRLEQKGYINRSRRAERGIEITDPSMGPFFREVAEVEVLGQITGNTVEYFDHIQYYDVVLDKLGNKQVFGLWFGSHEHNDWGFVPGDLLVIHETDEFDQNSMGLVIYDDKTIQIKTPPSEYAARQGRVLMLIRDYPCSEEVK